MDVWTMKLIWMAYASEFTSVQLLCTWKLLWPKSHQHFFSYFFFFFQFLYFNWTKIYFKTEWFSWMHHQYTFCKVSLLNSLLFMTVIRILLISIRIISLKRMILKLRTHINPMEYVRTSFWHTFVSIILNQKMFMQFESNQQKR